MAQIDGRKAALIAELDMCRGEMRSALEGCGRSLNLAERLRQSFRTHSVGWCAAAAAGGVGLALLITRRLRGGSRRDATPPPAPDGGARVSLGESLAAKSLSLLLGLATDMVRPVLMTWLGSLLSRTGAEGGGPADTRASDGHAPGKDRNRNS
jgi:hypothetical protein